MVIWPRQTTIFEMNVPIRVHNPELNTGSQWTTVQHERCTYVKNYLNDEFNSAVPMVKSKPNLLQNLRELLNLKDNGQMFRSPVV